LKFWPALDIRDAVEPDLLLAALDDYRPTAIEERGPDLRAFFADRAGRDAARAGLAAAFSVVPLDVPDEDWARRSQDNLTAVTVGRITIVPPWLQSASPRQPTDSGLDPLTIVILPSMGFGTGHHATTRLCLTALQQLDLVDRFVVDVGTGSGVLAFAARRLGAREALGIDHDPDAIQSARENLALNNAIDRVRFEALELRSATLPAADVVTANLTGALLVRAAAHLLSALEPGGTVVVSGLQTPDRDAVLAAFSAADLVWESEEDGWIALVFNLAGRTAV
jgi:ribosomal protein L11 methyltransferase